MKPFLKWAGNKYQIIEKIISVLPAGNRLIEPFVGSAAVFLNTNYSNYLLTDINADLIQLYQYLQHEGEVFVNYCCTFFTPENNSEKIFYELRDLFNTTQDTRLKSALFVYLNKHCFNGLCRYNAKGKFNTPFGKYKQPYFSAREMLCFYQKAQNAVFACMDFREAIYTAKKGDVIYCDPPYVPLSASANFTNYHADGFNLAKQQELAEIAKEIAKQGVTVIISNHATEFTKAIYQPAHLIPFAVQRFISCKAAKRNEVTEILAVFS
jgi:DNA adenine methylase